MYKTVHVQCVFLCRSVDAWQQCLATSTRHCPSLASAMTHEVDRVRRHLADTCPQQTTVGDIVQVSVAEDNPPPPQPGDDANQPETGPSSNDEGSGASEYESALNFVCFSQSSLCFAASHWLMWDLLCLSTLLLFLLQ